MQKKREERLTDAQRTLVEENIGLARTIAWKYKVSCARYGMDWDDVFSIACLGLVNAARSFDPTKGKPSTYLSYGCETAVLMELRRCRDVAHSAFATVSIQEPFGRNADGDELTYEGVLEAEGPGVEDEVIGRYAAGQVLAALDRRATSTQKRILRMYMHGMPQRKISEFYGHRQSWASRQIAACRKIVAEVLAS